MKLSLNASIAAPDAEDLLFVCGLCIVGKEGGGKSAARPSELQLTLGIPTLDDRVEKAADKAVAAADTVKHRDLTRLGNVPLVVAPEDSTPEVTVNIDNLAERGTEDAGVRELLADAVDHGLEAFDLGAEVLTAGFGTLDPEA